MIPDSCLLHIIPYYVTNQKNLQNAEALPGALIPAGRATRLEETMEPVGLDFINQRVGPWFRDWVREAAALADRAG